MCHPQRRALEPRAQPPGAEAFPTSTRDATWSRARRPRTSGSWHARATRSVSLLAWTLGALLLITSWASADKKPARRRVRAESAQTAAHLRKAQARAERLGLGQLKTAAKLLAAAPEASWVRAARHERWSGTLRFPVRGARASRGFGSGAGGYHQAVDIAAELGSPVHAASGGIVGYAGSQVSGYGNLIMLVHPSGFVTMYAHNRRNLVVAGQHVKRNQIIAELGSTGRSRGPHVHFELLWNGQNCDPMPLFRPVLGARDGGQPELRSVWKQPHRKPKTIRCGARKHHPDYRKHRVAEGEDGDES